MKIKISKLAKDDFDVALNYYKKQNESLAKRFKIDIKQSINRIGFFPNLYPKVNDRVQKCVIFKFPFTIFYTVIDDDIIILAFANHYKNPISYLKRL